MLVPNVNLWLQSKPKQQMDSRATALDSATPLHWALPKVTFISRKEEKGFEPKKLPKDHDLAFGAPHVFERLGDFFQPAPWAR